MATRKTKPDLASAFSAVGVEVPPKQYPKAPTGKDSSIRLLRELLEPLKVLAEDEELTLRELVEGELARVIWQSGNAEAKGLLEDAGWTKGPVARYPRPPRKGRG